MTTATCRRLAGHRGSGPDGRSFPWGPIDRVHTIGDIDVVEYREDCSNYAQPDACAERHGRVCFHPYIAGKDTGTSYDSLDSALVGAIAYKRRGPNDRSAWAFELMTRGVIAEDD